MACWMYFAFAINCYSPAVKFKQSDSMKQTIDLEESVWIQFDLGVLKGSIYSIRIEESDMDRLKNVQNSIVALKEVENF